MGRRSGTRSSSTRGRRKSAQLAAIDETFLAAAAPAAEPGRRPVAHLAERRVRPARRRHLRDRRPGTDEIPRGRPLPPEGPRQRALQQGQADADDARGRPDDHGLLALSRWTRRSCRSSPSRRPRSGEAFKANVRQPGRAALLADRPVRGRLRPVPEVRRPVARAHDERSTMFRTIVRKEITANLLSYKFFVVILLTGPVVVHQLLRHVPGLQEPAGRLRAHPAQARRADRRPAAQSAVDLRQGTGRGHDPVLRGRRDRDRGPGRPAVGQRRSSPFSPPRISSTSSRSSSRSWRFSSGSTRSAAKGRRGASADAVQSASPGRRSWWANGWAISSAWPFLSSWSPSSASS